MMHLGDCPCDVQRTAKTSWQGSLQESKGGVKLNMSANRPFALHLLDDNRLIAAGDKCDGVLIAETAPRGLACFLELKGAIDPEQRDHPFQQIEGAIAHFAPQPNDSAAHGEEHHALWREGRDLPSAKRGRTGTTALRVGKEHAVAGAIVVVRGGTRHPPRWMRVAGRDVFVAVIQRHGTRAEIELSLDEIESVVG